MEELISYIKEMRLNVSISHRNANCTNVLIDPGHGGISDGRYMTAPAKMCKFDDFTFYEGVFNRALMYVYAAKLEEISAGYTILVPEDDDISLGARVSRANHEKYIYPIDRVFFHSIHANADIQISKASGIEIWTTKGETKSDKLATVYFNSLKSVGWPMRADMSDGDVDKESEFFVLKHTNMPAILTETGFYTNRDEAKEMMQIPVIEKIAQCFTDAFVQIVELNLL